MNQGRGYEDQSERPSFTNNGTGKIPMPPNVPNFQGQFSNPNSNAIVNLGGPQFTLPSVDQKSNIAPPGGFGPPGLQNFPKPPGVGLPIPPSGPGFQMPGLPVPPGQGLPIPPGQNMPRPPGMGLPPGPGMGLPPGPGMGLPPAPGMGLPPGPGMGLPPGPGMGGPGMGLPPGPGMGGPSMGLPPGPGMGGPGMGLPPGPGKGLPTPPNMGFPPGPGMGLPPGPGMGLPTPPNMGPPGGFGMMPPIPNSGLPLPPGSGPMNQMTGPMIPKPAGPPLSMGMNAFVPQPPNNFKPQAPQAPDIIQNPSLSISLKRVSMSDEGINKASNDGRFNEITKRNPDVQIFRNDAGQGQSYINVVGSPDRVANVSNAISNMEKSQDNQWYFLNDNGKFEAYDQNANRIIDGGFSNGNQSTEISTGIKTYTILYGYDGFPHQQLLNGGQTHRTVRKGRLAGMDNFNYAKWLWADELTNQWKDYEPEACKLIENHYQRFLQKHEGYNLSTMPNKESLAKQESVLVSGTSGYAYILDFVNMVQRNENTLRWRAIKKEGMNMVLRVSQVKPEPIPWIQHPDLR